MSDLNPSSEDQAFVRRSLAAAIQIGLLFLLASWCLQIVMPFVGIVSWAAIISVALYPLHVKLTAALGGKEKFSVAIIVIVGLSILIAPTWKLTDSSIDSAHRLKAGLEAGTLAVPPPGDKVEDWPLIGKKVPTAEMMEIAPWKRLSAT